jgi:tRNA pseudouridine55 synthase
VVAFVKGRAREKRVGHAGTLDPFAEGVLPVCLGQATRIIEYLVDARKTYRAVVRLGRETDTYDHTGQVVAEADASGIDEASFRAALRRFEGEIEQIPPAFSALKRDGVPLYRLARAGEPVQVAPRRVSIYRIEPLSFVPPLTSFEVECGKGTYIRSLAHDIGRALGVGGSLDALVRTRVGPFAIERAVDIDTLRAEFESGDWTERLLWHDEVMLDWPAAMFAQDNETRLRNGQSVELTPASINGTGHARAYSVSGDFIGVVERQPAGLRPVKVFAPA